MSTTKSSGGDKNPPSSSSPTGANKKTKSKGFIEASDFKPGWLETGPLPPLAPPEPAATADNRSVAEELAALQEALQRYYGAETVDDEAQPDEPAVDEPLDDATRLIDATAAEPAPEEPAAPMTTAATTAEESHIEAPAAEPPAPPDWILAIAPPAEAAPISTTPPLPPVTVPSAFVEAAPLPDSAPEASVPELDMAALFVEPQVADDDFAFADEPVEVPVMPAAAPEPRPRRERRPRREPKPRRERPIRRRSRLSTALLVTSLLLLAAAAVVYFVNPFTRLALGLASLARPVASPSIAPPGPADDDGWCLQGSFPTGDALPVLMDDGAGGDLVADDQVFSLEYAIARPGDYRWQIVSCGDPTRTFPAAMAWLTTHEPNQLVTFVFDSNERADRLFFPIPYVVSAVDGVEDYRVVGSFQDYIVDDASARLEPLASGLYQQVRRIARSGDYDAYVIAGSLEQAIDAYGRTTEPIPFAFDTEQNGEYVVFLVDVDRGRASVMYDMPPLVTQLAFGGGNQLLAIGLAGLAGLLLLSLLLRELMLRNQRLWMESGCPRCHEQELMRISRRTSDRLLHLLAIPAYRYRCRNCTWEGTRLSEAGRAVSPGASIARIENPR